MTQFLRKIPWLALGLIILFTLWVGLSSPASAAPEQQNKYKVRVYMFWGDGCPHCAKAKPFLEGLSTKNKDLVELKFYEVWYVEANQELFKKMAAAYGIEVHSVPTIFIGPKHWEGYNDTITAEIESTVNACMKNACQDYGVGVLPGIEALNNPPAENNAVFDPASNTLNLPLLGKIDLSKQSLWISTLLIAFVDGVNPCSIWVLTMLLAITLHAGSRRKVLLIGLIFLTVTAAVYAAFIAGLFTMFTFVSFIGWIQVIVALAALFFAAVNIKDYFFYKEGISFTIDDAKKPGLFKRMRALMDASQSFGGLVVGTVVMAGGVSLVEFSCTAGFPVLWTNLLVAQKVGAGLFILLLLLYMLIYQLDEMVIFFTAVFTLKASKLEEKQGRILKLIGGMLMLSLAVVMLVNPSLMNSLGSALLIFGIALAATLLVLLVHRVLLPRMGVYIGTEMAPPKSKKTARRKKK